ncbi:hypothetical protein B0H11DRAFT_2182908 [Mycena galericulata]|nr:hypothetical protein B0H11DRAFT_2182908 [Mycena galericulata]
MYPHRDTRRRHEKYVELDSLTAVRELTEMGLRCISVNEVGNLKRARGKGRKAVRSIDRVQGGHDGEGRDEEGEKDEQMGRREKTEGERRGKTEGGGGFRIHMRKSTPRHRPPPLSENSVSRLDGKGGLREDRGKRKEKKARRREAGGGRQGGKRNDQGTKKRGACEENEYKDKDKMQGPRRRRGDGEYGVGRRVRGEQTAKERKAKVQESKEEEEEEGRRGDLDK